MILHKNKATEYPVEVLITELQNLKRKGCIKLDFFELMEILNISREDIKVIFNFKGD